MALALYYLNNCDMSATLHSDTIYSINKRFVNRALFESIDDNEVMQYPYITFLLLFSIAVIIFQQ